MGILIDIKSKDRAMIPIKQYSYNNATTLTNPSATPRDTIRTKTIVDPRTSSTSHFPSIRHKTQWFAKQEAHIAMFLSALTSYNRPYRCQCEVQIRGNGWLYSKSAVMQGRCFESHARDEFLY
jgi:hypothetical protein